mgnify:FL=1
MKEQSLLKTIVLSIAIIFSGYFISRFQVNSIQFNRSVQVKGLAQREVAADLAVWPIEITITGNNLTSLKSEIDKQKEDVIQFFTKSGFSGSEFTTGPTNIQDSKANIYSNGMNQPFRYIAKTEFTIRTSKIEKLQQTLTASLELIEEGVLLSSKDTWQPITYLFTGLNELC